MKILVLGGTRFFGITMVEELLRRGQDVTIAARQGGGGSVRSCAVRTV